MQRGYVLDKGPDHGTYVDHANDETHLERDRADSDALHLDESAADDRDQDLDEAEKEDLPLRIRVERNKEP